MTELGGEQSPGVEWAASSPEAAGAALRVVTWNCYQGLTAPKATALRGLEPTVAVVQECAESAQVPGYRQVAWNPAGHGLGTGVYASDRVPAVRYALGERASRWALAVRLPAAGLDVVGVWGFNRAGEAAPPGPVAREAIADLAPVLAGRSCIVLGDFNDGPHFDAGSARSFRKTWDLLEGHGCRSLHHALTAEGYGAESVRTFFRPRDGDRGWLIDHTFASTPLVGRVTRLGYGARSSWKMHSDHLPVVLEFSI